MRYIIVMKGGNEKMGCYGSCSSDCSSDMPRNFLTKAEKIEMLKGYQRQLENEAKGVAERIKHMSQSED